MATRVLVSSNAPWSGTGYGTQTRFILRAIRDAGFPVACVAWWGLEAGKAEWEGIPCFPQQFDGYGNDAMPHIAKTWKADVLITLIDLWVMDPGLGHLGGVRWCPLHPIDHDPIPPVVAERFPHAHRLLVYSRFAERMVKAYDGGKYADRVRYLPHGVDCSVYKPATDDERRAFRKKLYGDWPDGAFVCGMVAANKGWPCRKSFPEVMEAFALFAARHPEARLYLHSLPTQEMKGPDLQGMARFFGIADKVRLPNTPMLMGNDYDDATMRQIYCSFDVLLSPSQGEGFGLPIVEAQACGTSVVVTDFSAMPELVGCGWRVPPLRLIPTPIWGRQAEADVQGVLHAMEECYRRPKSPHWATIAREFALAYDWPTVVKAYWLPFLAEMDAGRRELALELEQPAA